MRHLFLTDGLGVGDQPATVVDVGDLLAVDDQLLISNRSVEERCQRSVVEDRSGKPLDHRVGIAERSIVLAGCCRLVAVDHRTDQGEHFDTIRHVERPHGHLLERGVAESFIGARPTSVTHRRAPRS